jgi:thymidylate synthase ThyX
MKKSSESIKVDMLDFAPNFKSAGPDKIMAASGILTMKNKDFVKTLGDMDEKVLKGFHNEATRRGHASLTTSINYYFWIEGSRIVDFYFSSFPFGSYLVFSSRRIEITPETLIIPDAIADSEFKEDYEKIAKKMVELYKRVNEETGRMDYARRILPIGFVSKLFMSIPLQTIVGIIKEVKEDKQRKTHVLPKELWKISGVLEKEVRKSTPMLAGASMKMLYNTNFPHPNLFKSNIEFMQPSTKVIVRDEKLEPMMSALSEKLRSLNGDHKERYTKAAGVWKDFVDDVQDKIVVEANIRGTLSIWNDIKRHRTVRQKVESIYDAADRCLKKWDESNLYIPQTSNELKKQIIDVYKEAFELYAKMVKGGIEKRDAIFIIPHGIRLGITMILDGYHFFDPFGFVGIRACTNTDHEIVSLTNNMVNDLKKEIPEIGNLMGPKCKLGRCPERNFCNIIKMFVKDYDKEMHLSY